MKTPKASCLCVMVTVMALGLVALGIEGVAAEIPTIRIPGTSGHDRIRIDEREDHIWVNDVDVAPAGYDGDGNYRYEVSTGKGNDSVEIAFDGSGNDIYVISTGQGDDWVSAIDGQGNDNYFVYTGQGNDVVSTTDWGVGSGNDNYFVDTGQDDDTATVADGFGNDKYIVRLGQGNDSIVVTDASTMDIYDLDGGQDNDELYMHDLAIGPPPSEGEGGEISIRSFEYMEVY